MNEITTAGIKYMYSQTTDKTPDLSYTLTATSFPKEITHRPWGSYEILYEDDKCKVKKIIIKPGQSPSYQKHEKRDELWQIISGVGEARIDDKYSTIMYGDNITVERTQAHCIQNIGENDLIFIEIQTGDSFSEDDIIRIEDMYGRETNK